MELFPLWIQGWRWEKQRAHLDVLSSCGKLRMEPLANLLAGGVVGIWMILSNTWWYQPIRQLHESGSILLGLRR